MIFYKLHNLYYPGQRFKNIKEETSGINVYIGSESEFDDDVTIFEA